MGGYPAASMVGKEYQNMDHFVRVGTNSYSPANRWSRFWCLDVFSDASVDLNDTPSTVIFIPAQFGHRARVASWEFLKGLLLLEREKEGSPG